MESTRILFEKYDSNKDGFLEFWEMKSIYDETYRQQNVPKNISNEEVHSFV